MALFNSAQQSRDSVAANLGGRILDVARDSNFQRVLRQEGWRLLVTVAAEARDAWLRTGRP
ncbi:hypothetical protein WDU99_12640 [Microbacterium sp. Mu-80]|uniref:Uncharacterized protein n=1 Tax=Microbacterium bandirmense TaxID=3122050 RepID=A0ABU8LDW5_9MICO